MTTSLTVEQRRKIAEACGRSIACFEPDEIATHFRDLVRRVAQEIKDLSSSCYEADIEQSVWATCVLINSLATNDILALESLLWELLENKDG